MNDKKEEIKTEEIVKEGEKQQQDKKIDLLQLLIDSLREKKEEKKQKLVDTLG